MSHCDKIQYFFIKAYFKAYFRHRFSGFFARILLVSLILYEHPYSLADFSFSLVFFFFFFNKMLKNIGFLFISDYLYFKNKNPHLNSAIKALFSCAKGRYVECIFCRQKSWCLANQWQQQWWKKESNSKSHAKSYQLGKLSADSAFSIRVLPPL